MAKLVNVQIALAAALLLSTLEPAAAVEVLGRKEEAIEIHLNLVEMPANEGGTVNFAGCRGCRTVTKRVTPETQYFLDGQQVPFAEFRAAVTELKVSHRGAESTLVGIFYNVESELVTRVKVLRAAN